MSTVVGNAGSYRFGNTTGSTFDWVTATSTPVTSYTGAALNTITSTLGITQ